MVTRPKITAWFLSLLCLKNLQRLPIALRMKCDSFAWCLKFLISFKATSSSLLVSGPHKPFEENKASFPYRTLFFSWPFCPRPPAVTSARSKQPSGPPPTLNPKPALSYFYCHQPEPSCSQVQPSWHLQEPLNWFGVSSPALHSLFLTQQSKWSFTKLNPISSLSKPFWWHSLHRQGSKASQCLQGPVWPGPCPSTQLHNLSHPGSYSPESPASFPFLTHAKPGLCLFSDSGTASFDGYRVDTFSLSLRPQLKLSLENFLTTLSAVPPSCLNIYQIVPFDFVDSL